jgi:GAF domain-containing protein
MESAHDTHEFKRLRMLQQFEILDSEAERSYDEVTHLAAAIARTPVALISIIADGRQWFKSSFGANIDHSPRESAFCTYAMQHPNEPLHVQDATLDARFAGDALVIGDPHLRFYFGIPLTTTQRYVLGTLCVMDYVPGQLSIQQQEELVSLSHLAMSKLELRRRVNSLRKASHFANTREGLT